MKVMVSSIEPATSSSPIARTERASRTSRVIRRERSRSEAARESQLREVDVDEILKLLGIGRNVNILA
jgi:hypothetical protein